VDFMPYEGTPPEGGHDSRRLMIAVLTVVAMLGGAWALTNGVPVSGESSSPQANPSRPSPKMAAQMTANGGDVGPGQSELAKRPATAR
jgi:hypothetical protein